MCLYVLGPIVTPPLHGAHPVQAGDEGPTGDDTKFDEFLGNDSGVLAGSGDYDEEDREADRVWDQIEDRMDGRRKVRKAWGWVGGWVGALVGSLAGVCGGSGSKRGGGRAGGVDGAHVCGGLCAS